MKLTIFERIVVSRFLPQKANYQLLKESEEIVKPKLTFNEEESRKFDIKGQTDKEGRQMVAFNREASEGYEADIRFTPIVAAHVAKELQSLSDKEGLEPGMLSVYEKFVLPPVPIVAGNPEDLKEQEKEIRAVKNGS